MLTLLGLSGSLRAGSHNSAILRALRDAMTGEVVLNLFPLNDLPLYNGDLDGDPALAPVAAFRAAISAADGVVIASPEYNYGMSGVMKNALDWASRPYGQAPLAAKPVLTLTSSMASTGGARAQAQLNETLTAIGARLVLRGQTVIGAAHERMLDGVFADEVSIAFAVEGVRHLAADIKRWQQFDAISG